MKNVFVSALLILFFNGSYAQWAASLTLKQTETFASISAASDKNIWAITRIFTIYDTKDGGIKWKRVQANGLAQNISILQLYAINSSTALLATTTNTGIGPGIVYRTTDGGKNWVQVFSHAGTCDIKFGMYDTIAGIMGCSFSSFNGSVQTGQDLYSTKDGGNTWKEIKNNPNKSVFINDLVVTGQLTAMVDYNNFYYSADKGLNWSKEKLPLRNTYYNQLQFTDSNYAIVNSGALIGLFAKRPGGKGWVKVQDPTIQSGALTGMVLDGSECWFGLGFDELNNYYSADSAKTFAPVIIDPFNGFLMMTKARTGSSIIGTTGGASARLWINKRIIAPQLKKPINALIKNYTIETQ